MVIILEGCDATGKSTLAEELSKVTGFGVFKGSSFEISELGADGMYEYMLELLSNDNIIIDRFMHSNIVYGNLFGYPTMSTEQYENILEKIDNTNSLVVYLHASEYDIKERLAIRGDDRIKEKDIVSIMDSYTETMLGGDLSPSLMLSINTSVIPSKNGAIAIKGFCQTV